MGVQADLQLSQSKNSDTSISLATTSDSLMGFHFNEEGDSTNYGPKAPHHKFPFPSADVLPSRNDRNTGNAYCSNTHLYSMDTLVCARQECLNTDAPVLIQFTTA